MISITKELSKIDIVENVPLLRTLNADNSFFGWIMTFYEVMKENVVTDSKLS